MSAFGQKITGDIAGDVTDASGAVVPNITVTAQSVDTGVTRSATTTSSGGYRIPELSIGKYKVTVSASGFKTVVQEVTVLSGGVMRADFKLQLGERAEVVEVEGAAPLVELSANNNNYIDAAKIETVPLNGRDFNSLLAITPGVQRAPGGGFLAVSINGARTSSNNYFIDGLYNNDRYYGDSAIGQTGVVGIPAIIFPPEAIQELSVQETPSSEFGVKGGAPILLGMKSGTNNLHGWANWVNHSGFGDASNYFTKHKGCDTEDACKHAPIHNNQFGAGIGGPIVKDKTFFLLYYEGQRYKASAVSSRTVPTPQQVQNARDDIANNGLTVDPAGEALLGFFPLDPSGNLIANTPTTATADSFGVKVDHHIGQSHTISAKYIFGDSLQSAPPYAGLPAGQNNPANLFNSIAPSRAQMAGVSWTWNRGNKILESRLGYTRFAQIIDVNNKIDPASLGMDTGPLSPADFGVPYVYLLPLGYGGYIGGVQGYPITTRPDQTWDWSEHFSWVKGNHNIKFGGNFQSAYTNSLRNRARTGMTLGYFSYYAPSSSGDPIQDAVEELLLGKADSASRNFGDTHRHIFQRSVGFYAQDDWKITPRLNISFGLRYDLNGALGEKDNIASNYFVGSGFKTLGQGLDRLYNLDYHDFGPHVGFAWDVFGNGKTAVRGGYSMTYDLWNIASLAAPYTFAGARAGIFSQPNLGQYASFSVSEGGNYWDSGLAPNDPASSCYNPDTGEGDYLCFSQGPLFGSSPTGTPPYNAFSIVPDFKTPRIHNFNLSIQQEVARNTVLTVGYSGSRGSNLLMYRDLNASPVGSPCTSGSSCDEFRPISADGPDGLRHIIQATNDSRSQYDSLQTSLNQRNWHGLNTQYNFTWSKCYDYNSSNRGGAGNYPQANNPYTPKDGYGLCDHDVRLNFNVGGVYSLPTLPGGQYLGKGWQISTIFTGISGRPFSALLGGGTDPTGQGMNGSSVRAAWDGTPIKYNTRNPDQYVVETFTAYDQPDPCGRLGSVDPDNPGHHLGDLALSPFYTPCPGTLGNSRRNQLIGPGLAQWDMTLIKDTKITEKVTLQARWEVYNVLNRGNFYYFPDNTLGATFGQITKTSDVAAGNPVIAQGGPRNMNFGLKIIF
ncbi:MAG: TonB-dependent receptor [Acidobacteria bacterium]|nr:TonB-dependent receptor [Acidobacteriota bacterium]